MITKDNAKLFLPLLQALADGKEVQLNVGSSSAPRWQTYSTLDFTACPEHYRIKPEPRRIFLNVYADQLDDWSNCLHGTREKADKDQSPCRSRRECIEFVEVVR